VRSKPEEAVLTACKHENSSGLDSAHLGCNTEGCAGDCVSPIAS
jgi:hypothetical protein